MTTCNHINCNSLCDYEFDVIGLYLNFKDKTLSDARYALDYWQLKTKVNLNEVQIGFRQINFRDCQEYGQFTEIENLRYLESLGSQRYNFYTDILNSSDDYIQLYNYIHCHRSLVIFYGQLNPIMEVEFDQYIRNNKVPIIHLTTKEYCKVFWNGIQDYDYELLYGSDLTRLR